MVEVLLWRIFLDLCECCRCYSGGVVCTPVYDAGDTAEKCLAPLCMLEVLQQRCVLHPVVCLCRNSGKGNWTPVSDRVVIV